MFCNSISPRNIFALTASLACFVGLAAAAPAAEKRVVPPTVALANSTVVGYSLLGIDSFKGIPYTQPPMESLRLKPPRPLTSNIGTVYATRVPRACPQTFTFSIPQTYRLALLHYLVTTQPSRLLRTPMRIVLLSVSR
jgi:hypothetical protein